MALTPGVSTDLAGLSVLVVEDEYFVANDSARALREHGARILGPVPDVQRARELLAGESPDVVVLTRPSFLRHCAERRACRSPSRVTNL